MKVKAILKDNKLYFTEQVNIRKSEVQVDVDNPDEVAEIVSTKKGFSEEIRSLFSQFPDAKMDWKKEWHKHLEEKYDG